MSIGGRRYRLTWLAPIVLMIALGLGLGPASTQAAGNRKLVYRSTNRSGFQVVMHRRGNRVIYIRVTYPKVCDDGRRTVSEFTSEEPHQIGPHGWVHIRYDWAIAQEEFSAHFGHGRATGIYQDFVGTERGEGGGGGGSAFCGSGDPEGRPLHFAARLGPPRTRQVRSGPKMIYRSTPRNGFGVVLRRRGNSVFFIDVVSPLVCSDGTRARGGFYEADVPVGKGGWARIRSFPENGGYTEFSAHFVQGRAVGFYREGRVRWDEETADHEPVACGNLAPGGRTQHFSARLVSVGGRKVG